MATVIADKYHLKTLHEEIDLFDRKIAHVLKHEAFETDQAREDAARKLTVKRETLAKTARRLAEEGIEFKDADLPRSFRPDGYIAIPVPAVAAALEAPAPAKKRNAVPTPVYAGTSLDWQQSVEHYMQKRGKA